MLIKEITRKRGEMDASEDFFEQIRINVSCAFIGEAIRTIRCGGVGFPPGMRPVVALYSPMLVSEKPLPAFVTNRFPPDTAMPTGKLFNPEINEALMIAPVVPSYSPTLASPVFVSKILSPSGSGHGTERDRRSQGGKKQSYIHRNFVRRPKRSESFQRFPLFALRWNGLPYSDQPAIFASSANEYQDCRVPDIAAFKCQPQSCKAAWRRLSVLT